MRNRNLRSIALKEVEDKLADSIKQIEKYISIYESYNCKLDIEYKLKKYRKKGSYRRIIK